MKEWLSRLLSTRPLDGPERWLRVAPFLVLLLVGLLAAWFAPPDRPRAVQLAAVLLLAVVGAVALVRWGRWPDRSHLMPALALLLVVGLLDYGAGSQVDIYLLSGLAVIWLALFHTRAMMYAGIALLAALLFIPLWLVPEAYPGRSWTSSLVVFLVFALGGLGAHLLVVRDRRATGEAWQAQVREQVDRGLLAAYLDSAACLVIALDWTGRVTLFNRYCEEVTGFQADELLGRRMWRTPEELPGMHALFDRASAGEGPVSAEEQLVTRDGRRRRIVWTATALTDHTGRTSHVVATGLDVTEQRATEQLFANVLASATEQLIYAVDTEGIFTVFNAGAERMLGYTNEELVGRQHERILFLPGELAAAAEQYAASGAREPPEGSTGPLAPEYQEWTLVRKDGSLVPVAMAITEMRRGDEPMGYVGVGHDITAERESARAQAEALAMAEAAADQLRELDTAKSDFVATASHELRTPLTSIVGNTEVLLEEGEALDGPQKRLLEAVHRNARRLERLISDLLMLSRIESGALSMSPREVAVGQVVEGALEALAGQQVGDVELTVHAPAEPVFVFGDLTLLERVMINLVGNALKFTPPGGQVEVTVRTDPGQVRLLVTDTGIGIPPEELPHVFDRFFRSSRSQDQHRPGTGLGLSIAKSIVEEHGGTIEARANPTGGTTFEIILPALRSEERQPRAEAT